MTLPRDIDRGYTGPGRNCGYTPGRMISVADTAALCHSLFMTNATNEITEQQIARAVEALRRSESDRGASPFSVARSAHARETMIRRIAAIRPDLRSHTQGLWLRQALRA